MKKIFVLLLGATLLSCASEKAPSLTVTNSSELERTDEAIALTRAELEKTIEIGDQLLPILKYPNGDFLPCQIDDLDNDGEWDELFALINMKGKEEVELSIELIATEIYPIPEARTNIRFANKKKEWEEADTAIREKHATNTITNKKWQMEGPAWENDKIGFRNYFDRRNGMDIFGKLTSKMVLDTVGSIDIESYHTFNPYWGMDVLKVGNSLGAGSVAYEIEDSLYRLGDNGLGTYELLTEGPLRSIYRLEFHNWVAGNDTLDVIHDISIQAGKYYYESQTSYSGTDKEIALVTGIVNKKSKELHKAASPDEVQAYYTFDVQAENGTLLGMGLMALSNEFEKTSTTKDEGKGITATYCMHLISKAKEINTFRFYSVWEIENDKWKTAEGFDDLLNKDAELMKNGIIVKLH